MKRPRTKLERRRYIAARMILLGLTQGEIAEELGVSTSLVGMVAMGERRNPRIKEAIRARLNVGYKWLWGEEREAA